MRLAIYALISPILLAGFVLALVGLTVRGSLVAFGIGYSAPENVRLRDLRRAWRASGKDYSNN